MSGRTVFALVVCLALTGCSSVDKEDAISSRADGEQGTVGIGGDPSTAGDATPSPGDPAVPNPPDPNGADAGGGGQADAGTSTETAAEAPQDSSGTQLGAVGGPGDRTGVSDTEFHVGITGNFPGGGPYTESFLQGFKAYFNEVNAAGGVHGRQIVAHYTDAGTTAETGVDAAKQLEGAVLFNCECNGSDSAVATGQYLDERGIPHFLTTGTESLVPTLKHAFIIYPLIEAMTQRSLEYMSTELGQRGKTIGLIRSNQKLYVAAEDVFKSYAPEVGLKAGPIRATEATQASFVPELQAMRDAGVSAILCHCTLEIGGLVRDAKSIGYDVEFSGPLFAFDLVSQIYAGQLDGVRSLRLIGTTDLPEYKTYQETARKYYPQGNASSDAFAFWGNAKFIVEVMRRAGPDPTRLRIEKAMETLTEFETGGATPPVSFGPNVRIGSRALMPVVCCNSKQEWKSEGPYRTSFK